MNKVVAFLEKYAQYLALLVAVGFLAFVGYSTFLANPSLDIKVGGEIKAPGDVDAAIAQNDAGRLTRAAGAEASEDYLKLLKAPTFDKDFVGVMGKERYANLPPLRPAVPGVPREGGPEIIEQNKVFVMSGVPVLPAADTVGSTSGQSFAMKPPPLPPLNMNNANPVPPPPPAIQPGQQVAGFDLNWITLEFRIDLKKVAAAWAAKFNDPKTGRRIFPDASAKTSILWVQVEREELIGPNQWGNHTILKPLPLTDVSQVADEVWGKLKNPDEEEGFRLWAEKNQMNIVEPPFFQTVSGDTWKTVSTAPAIENGAAGAAVQPVIQGPFDPANPPKDRELTPDEKRQVYVFNQQQKKEKEKQEAAERKAKAQAAEAARKAKSPAMPVAPTTPGKRPAGYAPIPLAADGEFGGRPAAPGTGRGGAGGAAGGAAGGVGAPPGRVPRPPQTGGPLAPGDRRPAVNPEVARPAPVAGGPAIPTTFMPNPVLSGPFDPMEVVVPNPTAVVQQPTDIVVWAHDPTAQPGKIYRYSMKYYMKNPLHLTHGFTKNPNDAKLFALESPASPWITATAPQNVHFFFAKKKVNPRNQAVVDFVEVDVFKREKGAWTKQTFTVVPGDNIGQTVNNVDFGTGNTVVDLRLDARNDVRVLIADETGDVRTRTLQSDLNDDWYKELQQKVNAPAGPNAAANQ